MKTKVQKKVSRPSLAELREERGWSRAELARQANLNAATVGQIESRKLAPYTGQIFKLAQAFGVEVDEIKRRVRMMEGDA